jgi:hypothetical protein
MVRLSLCRNWCMKAWRSTSSSHEMIGTATIYLYHLLPLLLSFPINYTFSFLKPNPFSPTPNNFLFKDTRLMLLSSIGIPITLEVWSSHSETELLGLVKVDYLLQVLHMFSYSKDFMQFRQRLINFLLIIWVILASCRIKSFLKA